MGTQHMEKCMWEHSNEARGLGPLCWQLCLLWSLAPTFLSINVGRVPPQIKELCLMSERSEASKTLSGVYKFELVRFISYYILRNITSQL